MRDSEIIVMAKKVKETEVPPYVKDMYSCIGNPRDFKAALAAGERLLSQYKNNQAGTPLISIPELCILYDIGKMKLYEILRGGKYKYPPKEEEIEKKMVRRIKPDPVEDAPPKKVKKTKAAPTT